MAKAKKKNPMAVALGKLRAKKAGKKGMAALGKKGCASRWGKAEARNLP